MSVCSICPRKCAVDRYNHKGYCGVKNDKIYCARAALHFWEEPCISGVKGSGTVFFSGCNLRCVYCQNYNISSADVGRGITVDRLSDIFIELMQKGANNINLVTPTHYTDEIIKAVGLSRNKGLSIPIVYNCSGYESIDTLKKLRGIVDIYLTDFKYMDSTLAKRYSSAYDYPEIAKAALAEMFEQQSECVFDDEGLMKKGIIVRNLLLPSCVDNSKAVVKYVFETYGNSVYLSLMKQFTPVTDLSDYPEINRKVTKREYNRLVDYALDLGVENAFIQEGRVAEESFIPVFDYEGI